MFSTGGQDGGLCLGSGLHHGSLYGLALLTLGGAVALLIVAAVVIAAVTALAAGLLLGGSIGNLVHGLDGAIYRAEAQKALTTLVDDGVHDGGGRGGAQLDDGLLDGLLPSLGANFNFLFHSGCLCPFHGRKPPRWGGLPIDYRRFCDDGATV
jgi:hypothetical protein